MKENAFEEFVNMRFNDLLTYIIEITEPEILKSELLLCTMSDNEYNNIESISFLRKCELIWIFNKYLDERDDERRYPIDKTHMFKHDVHTKFDMISTGKMKKRKESIINRWKDNTDPVFWR